MRTNYVKQIKVIQSNSPSEFERQANEALMELANQNAQVEFNKDMGHCLYILYDVQEEICETAEDELKKRGVTLHCRNCPNFNWDRNKDGSVRQISKKGKCHMATYGSTSRDTLACDYFCRAVLNGELIPISEEDIADMLKGEYR